MLVFYFFLSPSVDVSLKPDLSHSYIIPVITFYLTPANHKADTSFSRGSLEQGVEKLSWNLLVKIRLHFLLWLLEENKQSGGL